MASDRRRAAGDKLLPMLRGNTAIQRLMDRRAGFWLPPAVAVALLLSVWARGTWTRRASADVEAAPTGPPPAAVAGQPVRVARVTQPHLNLPVADVDWLRRQYQPAADEALSVSYCLHVLRVHGLGAALHDPKLASSDAVLDLLLNAESGRAQFGRSPLVITRSGLRFDMNDGAAVQTGVWRESHRDQCLAAFGELGVPLSRAVEAGGKHFTVHALLDDSLANFHLKQDELAWTAIAYALYLPPTGEWQNRFGERFDFDDLVGRLLERRLDQESCGGTHLIYALTLLSRVDRMSPVLSSDVRDELAERLHRFVDVTVCAQQPDGSWRFDWRRELGDAAGLSLRPMEGNSSGERVLLTGHLCEWMLMLPEELQPPSDVLDRAAGWLLEELKATSDEERVREFCRYSHAVCVLRHLTDSKGPVARAVGIEVVPASQAEI